MVESKVVFATLPGLVFNAPVYRTTLEANAPPGYRIEYVEPDAGEDILTSALVEADFLLGFPPASGGALRSARQLKLIQLMGAGYDYLDHVTAANLGIPIANASGANSATVAEHTILLMLSALHRFEQLMADTRAGRWRSQLGEDDIHELAGRRVGIVGFGSIGRAVAARLAGWDVELSYFDGIRQFEHESLAPYLPLDELLATSDIVTIHVPLIDSTWHLLNASRLSLMKSTAIVINTARGAVIDEGALYEALKAGRIAGAGLDVWEEEPPDPANPLLTLPNVVPTPHTAGQASETWLRRCVDSFENFDRVREGKEPLRRIV